jgi:hypothetical protein
MFQKPDRRFGMTKKLDDSHLVLTEFLVIPRISAKKNQRILKKIFLDLNIIELFDITNATRL